ncbi:hypothetical protein JTB14_018911 [Gonioctena quinquepunctata]|nr:hypothetical protein JTB14_018911 [Gonioctena quinquepunctata]
MEKIQSTTVCQERVEDVMNNVFTSAPDFVDMSTSVPYFIMDPPILPTLEREENWDADNYTTYTPNLDGQGYHQTTVDWKIKKKRENFGRQSDYDIADWRNKKIEK